MAQQASAALSSVPAPRATKLNALMVERGEFPGPVELDT